MLSVGRSVYLWRKERCLTQDKLAHLTGVSRPNISAIEQGHRDITVSTLRCLADALKIQPGVLVNGESPGPVDRAGLTRAEMERIVNWVSGKSVQLSDAEKEIASSLETLVRHGMKKGYGSGRILPRTLQKEKQALRFLSSKLSKAEINNLLSHVRKFLWGSA